MYGTSIEFLVTQSESVRTTVNSKLSARKPDSILQEIIWRQQSGQLNQIEPSIADFGEATSSTKPLTRLHARILVKQSGQLNQLDPSTAYDDQRSSNLVK